MATGGSWKCSSVALCLLLVACSSGEDSRSVRGAATKGPLHDAQVGLFLVDNNGDETGSAVLTTNTGTSGNFSLTRPASGPGATEPLLVKTDGGFFFDESDRRGRRKVTFLSSQGMQALLPGGLEQVAVTPFSQALLLKSRRETSPALGNFHQVHARNRALWQDAYGFDVLSELPANPVAPSGSEAEKQYAMALGGFALAANQAAARLRRKVDYALIEALITDLSDGRLDGKENGAAVPVGTSGKNLPTNVGLNTNIKRFRNNNRRKYSGVPLVVVKQSLAAQSRANTAPVANDDSENTAEESDVIVDVVANDTDAQDGVPGGAVNVTGATNGTAVVNPDRTVTFTPAADFSGAATFTYTVRDSEGAVSNSATASITVNNVNDPPAAVNDGPFTTSEDVPTSPIDVVSNDTDLEDGTPTGVVTITAQSNGVAVVNPDRTVTFTPAANQNGPTGFGFAYTVKDSFGATSNVANVSVGVTPVNDNPTAVDDSPGVSEDSAGNLLDVLANDSAAPDGPETLSIAAVGTPSQGGSAGISGNKISYTPAADFAGTETFTYSISDGNGGTAGATVTVNVGNTNDGPTAADDSFTVGEDSTTVLDVRSNDSTAPDVGETLTITSVSGFSQGGSATTNGSTISYTPALNFNGGETFSYAVSDGNGGTDSATVTMTVTNVNDAPTLTIGGNQSVNEDSGPHVVPAFASKGAGGGADESGQVVTLSISGNSNPALFAAGPDISQSGDLTYTPDTDAFGSATVTVQAQDDGTTANGGADTTTRTFTITVNPVNDAPSFTKGADVTVAEDSGAFSQPGWATAISPCPPSRPVCAANETSQLVTFITSNSNNALFAAGQQPAVMPDGELRFTPAANAFGSATVTIFAMDNGTTANGGVNQSATQSFLITVNNVNDAPTFDQPANQAVNEDSGSQTVTISNVKPGAGNETEAVTLSVVANSDPDNVLASLAVAPPATSTSATRSITYSLKPNAHTQVSGPITITVTADDGQGPPNNSASRTFTLSVNSVPDAPDAVNDSPAGIPEDSPEIIINVLANDTDGDINRGAAGLTSPPHTVAIANATNAHAQTLFAASDGSIHYRPDANYFGPVSFTYQLTDTDGADTATVSFTVNGVNDAPFADNDTAITTKNSPVNIAVLTGDSDADGGLVPATVTIVTPPAAGASATPQANGTVNYSPPPGFAGSDSFQYTVQDNQGATSNVATVNVTIDDVNIPPTATNDSYQVAKGCSLRVPAPGLLANDSDVEDVQPAIANLVSAPADASSFVLNADGSFVYAHDGSGLAPDSFTYSAKDSGGFSSAPATVDIEVVDIPCVELVSGLADGSQDGAPSYGAFASPFDPVAGVAATYAVFESLGEFDGTDQTTPTQHIFRKDVITGDIDLVSRNGSGQQANASSNSFRPVVDHSGRYVFFETDADNFGFAQSLGDPTQVVRKDMVSGAVTLVSRALAGAGVGGNSSANLPAITPDGRYVTFASTADNLVSGVSGFNIFRVDLSGAEPLVELAGQSVSSSYSSISADGRYVLFASPVAHAAGDTNGTHDVYLRDMDCALGDTGCDEYLLVSENEAGTPGNGVSTLAEMGAMSADGKRVLFHSNATNLAGADANGTGTDIYVKDMGSGAVARINVSSDASVQTPGFTAVGRLSADGLVATFAYNGTDLGTGKTSGSTDVFVKQLPITLVSGNAVGTLKSYSMGFGSPSGTAPPDGSSDDSMPSSMGDVVFFTSNASNLVPIDTNLSADVLRGFSQGIGDNDADGMDDDDGDGLSDRKEAQLGTSPAFADSDADNLEDGQEFYVVGTDPLDADTDGDGLTDDLDPEPLQSASQPASFSASSYFAGDNPRSVAITDYDRDGNPDRVHATFSSIQVERGDGSGGFPGGAGSGSFTNGAMNQPIAVVAGDFNLNGEPDLAWANFGGGSVAIQLDIGDGNFGGPPTSAVGTNPRALASGDFNSDGKPDLAVANNGSDNVSILLGDGAGGATPASPATVAVGTGPNSVAVGDFDADGNPDFVTANDGGGNGNLSVRLGNGDGSFTGSTDITVGGFAASVAVGDFDADGNADLVTANGASSVAVLLGDGAGGFAPAGNTTVGLSPLSVTTDDFNGDGKLDLAVANRDDNDVSVLLGDGSGGFGTRADVAVGTGPAALAAGDFNRDARPDLLVANTGTNTVSVLLNTGTFSSSGSFGTANNFATGATPRALAAGDVDRNGKLDLATANFNGGSVSSLLGDGSGAFGAPSHWTVETGPHSVAMGDLDRDGKLDLVAANASTSSVSVLLGSGGGAFGSASNFAMASGGHSVAIGDLNRDGIPDLAVANGGSNKVSILLGTGGGNFGPAAEFGVGTTPLMLAIADLDRDGKPDLVTANQNSNDLSVLLGDGSGGVGPASNFAAGGAQPYAVAVGDVNRDGIFDLACANRVGNNLSVLLGTGTGSFVAATTFDAAGQGPMSVAIGDLNRDGKPDLAAAYQDGDSVAIRLGDGAGGFGSAALYPTGDGPSSVTINDFDHDGRPDLAVGNQFANAVSVLLGQ